SRSTLMSAGFGGHEGRRLRNGDVLHIGGENGSAPTSLASGATAADALYRPRFPADQERILIMRGPQAHLFDEDTWSTFLGTRYTISRASDRTGYRLDGRSLSHGGDAALPSEPTCVGAIQVPNGGAPIVLMQDGPTIGGYPKIAVIRSTELSRFAQKVPGDSVRFSR
ncbi:MAG: biotin-dependent carboxyltransferase family protein, partial [Gemmatimonadaceae bacterium]